MDSTLEQISQVAAAKNIGEVFKDLPSHNIDAYESKELTFAMVMSQHIPILSGDATRVKQCLNNFLSNALK